MASFTFLLMGSILYSVSVFSLHLKGDIVNLTLEQVSFPITNVLSKT